ncbi:hypothetical protein AB0F72_28800 [Actinoplanes sp. NPDC023936]|uniref:nickel/cobalt transporter n=1 Tax=Actinoplanes sp. NPDC023936 TaxID=3154910 RepID=UPI0033D48621
MFRIMAVAAGAVAVLAWPAAPASAHPLGNFSVNQYAGLTLRPDRVEAAVVIDAAEIPTLQDKSGDAGARCARVAAAFTVAVHDRPLVWTVSGPTHALMPGAGGLETSRLGCLLSAPADLTGPATVRVDNGYRTDRLGWREMTAIGAGVTLAHSDVPARSVTGMLRSYPEDPLASPLDVRSATIRVSGAGPGVSNAGGGPVPPDETGADSGLLRTAQSRVESALDGQLGPAVVILAFLLSLLLGAGHAVLPGHGKTVMAAYFAGRRGRIRDAVAVGATVTLAHTAGVLLLGMVLSTSTALAGERVLSALGVVAGVLVVTVGAGMLVSARRARRHTALPHDHVHATPSPDGPHAHAPHAHAPHGHHHHGPQAGGRLNLAGIGLAGGLVPSPSALVVLLGAIGLGRAGLGVALILAYGIGMAATLTAIGLLLVVARPRMARLIPTGSRAARLTGRLSTSVPFATATLVVIVGLGIGARALTLTLA